MSEAHTPLYLGIADVSQKQAYIFAEKGLRENVSRSQLIDKVTGYDYVQTCYPNFSNQNQVYAGGGHTLFQFDDLDTAKACMQKLTYRAYTDYGIELFTKLIPYDPAQAPSENIKALIQALETKKSLRASAFRQHGIGLEETAVQKAPYDKSIDKKEKALFHCNKKSPKDSDILCGKDNFLAVIHIDGNSMGDKAQKVTDEANAGWEDCCVKHRAFSKQVDELFKSVLGKVICLVEQQQNSGYLESIGFTADSEYHPFRPLIAAGDDITFIVPASIALECAAAYMRILQEDSKGAFSACAGVVMVHKKYPFYRAYEMAEAFCDSAKKYAAELREQTGKKEVSAIDWHIEFGQGKGSVSLIREDYITEDSESGLTEEAPIRTLTLRPLCVGDTGNPCRTYDYFVRLMTAFQRQDYPRSKIKGLREALKQGEDATMTYLRTNEISSITKLGFDAKAGDSIHEEIVKNQGRSKLFFVDGSEHTENKQSRFVRRGLYFDAIEMMDNMILFREEAVK